MNSPSLDQSLGEYKTTHDKKITIICTNYLKNIRYDLIEENDNMVPIRNNEIVYVSAQINGILSTIMIDTGSNVSLIDQIELNRLQQGSSVPIPTLPINNITIIGATGRQNKTVRKQVSLELNSKGIIVTMPFLVASGLPFSLLVGCDVLRQHSAIINLRQGEVSLTTEQGIWSADLVNGGNLPLITNSCNMIQNNYCQQSPERILTDWKDEELWSSKLDEIRNFQREEQDPQISVQQSEELIRIYNRCKHIFSDAPGKVKDYHCLLYTSRCV